MEHEHAAELVAHLRADQFGNHHVVDSDIDGAFPVYTAYQPTPSAIEAWAALIANGLLGQASEEDVREVELKIYELLGVKS